MPARQSSWDIVATAQLVQDLESVYGCEPLPPLTDPMDELVACILSQHTSDKNSIPAFERLKAAYPTWEGMVAAGREAIIEPIRNAGLANQKSKTILRCLHEIKERVGEYSLEHLRTMPPIQAREWLTQLPGIGPKTASIVLCFSLGMGVIPVDTHVFRVAWRLGMVDRKKGEGKAHDALIQVVSGELAYRFHMALIRHGREVCKAPTPKCDRCIVKDRCDWFVDHAKGAQMTDRNQPKTPQRASKKAAR